MVRLIGQQWTGQRMKINVGRIAGGGKQLRKMQKRGQSKRRRYRTKTKSKGAQKDRKRGKTLLTSTEGHGEKEVTMFFRIHKSCLIWAWCVSFNKNSCFPFYLSVQLLRCQQCVFIFSFFKDRLDEQENLSGFCRKSRGIHTAHM